MYKENVAFTFQNTDKRIVFVIPYKGKFSLIGTTEIEVKSPENKGISKKEIKYLISSVNNYLKKQIYPIKVKNWWQVKRMKQRNR